MTRLADRLPDFPWDLLAPYAATARAHPDGIVDLSVGTPVDPVPAVVQQALAAASNWPGYPTNWGTPALRDAICRWAGRTLHADLDHANVLPTIGSKELVSLLPLLLGLGPSDTVVIPEVAYPTYDVGARIAGCRIIAADSTVALGPQKVSLVWLNTPSNPTGRVLGVEHLAKVVEWARARGAVVVSDECYFELGWDAEPVSVLDARVNGGSLEGILSVHSLSKRSNLAGYREGFVLGDAALVGALLEARKHMGLMVPGPVQDASIAALDDDAHVAEQRERYRARRVRLRGALESAGFTIDHSEAGLYLWSTRGEPCWDTIGWLAQRGILAAPGAFYGAGGERHVRVALTETDERVEAAVARLAKD